MTIAAIDDFVQSIKLRKSANTVKAYKKDLVQFVQYCEAHGVDVLQATPRQINSFLASLGMSRRTLERKRASISSFYSFLKRQRLIPANPVEEVERFKLPRRKPDYLTIPEISAMRGNCPAGFLPLFEFLLATGVRVSEACALNRRHVDLEKRLARVTGKGDKERLVMLSQRATGLLQVYLNSRTDTNEALFVRKNRRYTPNMIYYYIRRLGEKAIGRRVWPHLLRHCFGTYLVAGGATLVEAQQLLGHESIASTVVYAHPTAALRESYDKAMGQFES